MARPRLEPGHHGEISVSAKKNARGLYRAKAYRRDASGERHAVSAERATKGEARAAVVTKLEALAREPEDPAGVPVTVREAVWDWWRSKPSYDVDARRAASPQTLSLYARTIRRSIEPHLGEVAIVDLTAGAVQAVLDRIVGEGGGFAESKRTLTIVKQALDRAVLHDLIPFNPVMACKAPQTARRRPRALTDPELLAVLAAARGWQEGGSKNGPARSAVLIDTLVVMLGLGVRIGEALALRWQDVDLDHGLVHVRGTLVDQPAYELEDGTRVASRFFRQDWRKSGKDKEDLIVEAPSFVLDVLTRRWQQSPAQNSIGAVFVTRADSWHRPSNVRRQFREAKEEAGLRMELDWAKPHKLRTTALSAVANAVDVDAAARLAGHASRRTTELFYVDPGPVAPVRQASVLERFGAAARR